MIMLRTLALTALLVVGLDAVWHGLQLGWAWLGSVGVLAELHRAGLWAWDYGRNLLGEQRVDLLDQLWQQRLFRIGAAMAAASLGFGLLPLNDQLPRWVERLIVGVWLLLIVFGCGGGVALMTLTVLRQFDINIAFDG
jgi:hypothetical protein